MHKWLTVILACLGMAGALAIDAFLPSIPAIGVAFDVGPLAVQQTLSLYLFTFAFMMLFYGTLSDSFGRRPVLLVAFSLYTIASAGAAFAPSFGWLLACRALQGLAAGAGSVISTAIVQDRFSGAQAQKMMSHIMMVFGLAPAIAPIIGGWLQVLFGWQATFAFLTVFGLVMIGVIYFVLPESLPPEQRHEFHPVVIASNYWKVLSNHKFLLLGASLGLVFGGLSLYIGSAAQFVMGILHMSETAFAWMFVPLIGGMTLGSAIGGKFTAKFSQRKMTVMGFAIMIAGGVLNVSYNCFFVADVPGAVLPLAVYTFGLAFTMPAIQMAALQIFPDNRGLASSLMSFITMMAFALVSGLVAPLLFDSALKLAIGLLTGTVLGFALWKTAD